MNWPLTPGKLGFALNRVLIALKAGTLDTPQAVNATRGALHTSTVMADGSQMDAFGRQRVSIANTLFDAQQEYGLDTRTTWDASANGTMSVAHSNGSAVSGSNSVGPVNSDTRLTPITVSTTNGHYAVLQSGQYVRYIPGKSHFIVITGIFASGASATARVVLRSSTSGAAVDTAVDQASWNIDKFDGSGPSEITSIDFTKVQILVIDAQMLYSGRIRVGFDVGGVLWWAHEFLVANQQLLPTMQTFNLPVRAEIRNTAASVSKSRFGYFDAANGVFVETERAVAGGTVNFLCCSVQTEGGVEARGFPRAASRGTSTVGVTTRRPVISIRQGALYNGRTNRAHIEEIIANLRATGNDAHYEIVVGGTLSNASWLRVGAASTAGAFVVGQSYFILTVGSTDFTLIGASANTVGLQFTATGAGTGTGTAAIAESTAEYDISADGITGGTTIFQGDVGAGSGVVSGNTSAFVDIRSPLVLRKIDALAASQIPVSVVCTSFSGTSTIGASLIWNEQTL